MKAISLWQPHASLITTGAKIYETRHWTTNIRGDILIHAALSRKDMAAMWQGEDCMRRYVEALEPLLVKNLDSWSLRCATITDALPFGALVGVAKLGRPLSIGNVNFGFDITEAIAAKQGNGFGDFSPGRFAWPLTDVRRFETPIPWKGRQGFFNVDIDLREHPTVKV